MKSPPVQHPDDKARDEVEDFIRRNSRTHARSRLPAPQPAGT